MKWRGLTRRSLPYLVAVTSGFLLAYLIVALFIFPASLVSSDTRVPNVEGLPWDSASKVLKKAGFTAQKGEQRYTNDSPAGVVLAQNPVALTIQPKGGKVVLDLSRGQRTVEVPQLVGLTRPQAELALENAGLDVGDVTERQNDAPRGQVLSSSPAARTEVPIPSAVSFAVSAGPALVQVPDVSGQSYAAARQLLVQLGFQVAEGKPDSLSLAAPGTVTSQNPAAGQTVPGGTTVRLTIAVVPSGAAPRAPSRP